MESFKDMFLEMREQESNVLTSVKNLEKEKLSSIEYLCGLNFKQTNKLNQHDRLPDNNLHHGSGTDDDGPWLYEKNNCDGSVAVFNGAMECSHNTHD
jgi:hypothetical protein